MELNDKKIDDNIERINISIGVYAITGFSLLIYIFWIFLEDITKLSYITLIIDLAWFCYSRRILQLNGDGDYTKNYIGNYIICAFLCFVVYNLDISMLYRNICILLACCEGFMRTFFIEIRKLINKSSDIELLE